MIRQIYLTLKATSKNVSLDKENYLVFDKSPFYAEMGGQRGDEGTVFINDQSIIITDVAKDASGRFLHKIKEPGSSKEFSGKAILSVNSRLRQNIQCHHTATHILHWALREVLGDHVKQAGSLVEENRLRFDFSHYEAVSEAQLKEIETIANAKLLLNEEVESYEIPFSEKPEEVVAFLEKSTEKKVRVVNVGGWSQELCGGTHVSRAGEIGSIRITSESAISAGNRRIEAVAGDAAFSWINQRISVIDQLVQDLACKPEDISSRISQIQKKTKIWRKKFIPSRRKITQVWQMNLLTVQSKSEISVWSKPALKMFQQMNYDHSQPKSIRDVLHQLFSLQAIMKASAE